MVALSGGCTSTGLWLHKVGGFLFTSSGIEGFLSLCLASSTTGCTVVTDIDVHEQTEKSGNGKQLHAETVEIIE